MVPTSIISLLFVAAFLLTLWQYFRIDPRRRILNLRFVMMICAVTAAIGYPVFVANHRAGRHASWWVLGLALFWLASSYYMSRRMPPPEQY